MGIILGLSAALFWGTADFLVRYSTRIIGTYRTLFYMQFIGFACLSIFLASFRRVYAPGSTHKLAMVDIGNPDRLAQCYKCAGTLSFF